MAMREARSRSMERSPLRELVAARASCDSTTMTASLGLGIVLTMDDCMHMHYDAARLEFCKGRYG